MTISLKDGGTTATTGGTVKDFTRTNSPVTNGNEYVDVAEANFFLRDKIIVVTRQPSLQSDGSYSKQKTSLRFIKPITLADGSVVYNVTRVETEIHPETPSADLAEHREIGGQMAIGSAFDDIYIAGTLPA